MSRNDDENGDAEVLNFPRVYMPGSFDASDSPNGPSAFAGGESPADAWPELPWADDDLRPPPTLNLPAIPSSREVVEDDGAFAPVAMEDPDNPTARDTVQLAMALVTAMGVAAAQGMWHRARQRQAAADRARANADKVGGKGSAGSASGGSAGRGGGSGSADGGSRGSRGVLGRSRAESSGRRSSGSGSGSGGHSGRSGDRRRPPGGSAGERPGSRSSEHAPKADKDGKRRPARSERKPKTLARKLARAERRGRKKARRKLNRTGPGAEPCVQNETPETTTEQSHRKKRDKKRRSSGEPRTGRGKWKWKAAPKDPANSEAQPEISRRKRWKRDKPDSPEKKRWRFKRRRRNTSDGHRERRRQERDTRKQQREEARQERQRRRRWWKASPDWLNRWRKRRSTGSPDGPETAGEHGSWDETSWTEWMRPPPWVDETDHFEVEVEVVRPNRPALNRPTPELLSAEHAHHQEGAPSMDAPVRPAQYGDAELTVYDVIDADSDMADEITAGVDEARATVAGCELLMTRLEMLHAKIVELRVPGVLAGMVTLLMEITVSVKVKAETIAAKLPAAAEAIRTAGANAEFRHRPLADAVRDAGHTRPAEREYHEE